MFEKCYVNYVLMKQLNFIQFVKIVYDFVISQKRLFFYHQKSTNLTYYDEN